MEKEMPIPFVRVAQCTVYHFCIRGKIYSFYISIQRLFPGEIPESIGDWDLAAKYDIDCNIYGLISLTMYIMVAMINDRCLIWSYCWPCDTFLNWWCWGWSLEKIVWKKIRDVSIDQTQSGNTFTIWVCWSYCWHADVRWACLFMTLCR